LSVSEDTLGTGWSFSRCYKCGGFALIRRAEINIIKVDKAPPGERVILPEASKDPTTAMLSEDATQKLARHMAFKPQKSEKAPVQPPPPPQYAVQNPNLQARHTNVAGPSTFPQTLQAASSARFPDPLPDTPVEAPRSKAIPVGIALTATMAITSGVYLYMQSQALWHKARDMVKESTRENKISKASSSTQNPESVAPTLEKSLTVEQAHPLTASNTSDSNQTGQMAPARTTFTGMVPHDLHQENQAHASTSSLSSFQAGSKQVGETTTPKTSAFSLPSHAFMVKVRLSRANLHSGPGAEFPVVGEATPNLQYLVSDWNNRWFRLTTTGHDSRTVGWVRNDLVQVLNQ
jgi:hypothetical protein